MFRAGDEFLNTQSGNNNPYNQDNEISWLDWNQLQTNADIFRFFKSMIAFRKASSFHQPEQVLAGGRVLVRGRPQSRFCPSDSRSLAFCLHGASQGDDDIYVMINAYWDELLFEIQEGTPKEWRRIVDTALLSPDDFSEQGVSLDATRVETRYAVGPRSIVVLLRPRSPMATERSVLP